MLNRIKDLRQRFGITQSSLAKYLGVAQNTLSYWEQGKYDVDNASLNKLADFFGCSVDYILCRLDEIKNTPKGAKAPVLGVIRAGLPIEAVQNIIDYEEISDELAHSGEFFALKIKGDSMEPKMSEGDVVIVRKQESVDNGQVAVVLINGEDATIKKYQKTDNGVKLIATNPAYDPLFFTPDEVENLPVRVIGRVVELRQKYY